MKDPGHAAEDVNCWTNHRPDRVVWPLSWDMSYMWLLTSRTLVVRQTTMYVCER